jgi:hypothetical protein
LNFQVSAGFGAGQVQGLVLTAFPVKSMRSKNQAAFDWLTWHPFSPLWVWQTDFSELSPCGYPFDSSLWP